MPAKKNHDTSSEDRLLRVKTILDEKLPVSKTLFLGFVRQGRMPQPYKLTSKCVVWKESELDAAIALMLADGKL